MVTVDRAVSSRNPFFRAAPESNYLSPSCPPQGGTLFRPLRCGDFVSVPITVLFYRQETLPMTILSLSKVPQHLHSQVLRKVLFWGMIIVSAATFICYYQVFNRSKDKTLSALRQYMDERSQQEYQTFTGAITRLEFFCKEFMKMYLSGVSFSEDDFWRFYYVDKEGATRMKKEFFNEHFDPEMGRQWGMSSFIGNNQSVASRDFQRRLLISNILVNRYGPAWYPDGLLHVTYPENAIVIFYPDDPWGLNAKPDLTMNELGTIKATLQSTNPDRKAVWTGLYYDETAGEWTITYEIPVDYGGRHLINPSMDVQLKSVMNRLDTDHPEGAYNFIIRKDGYLVIPPSKLGNELKMKGQLSLDKIDNPDIVRMYHKIHESAATTNKGASVIDDTEGENYLLVSFLPGPDWWFVMVYPKELIALEAHHISRIVLFLGFSLFILYYLAVYYIISKQVRLPLQRLQNAVSLIAQGKYEEVLQYPQALPLEQKNEIGQLAGAFLDMSTDVYHVNANLQSIVESRTKELEDANAKLRDLSLLDALTGIHNRRSFDRDIAKVFGQAKSGVDSFSLLLADIDYFKNYNDIYGHTAGDEALRKVSAVIARSIREEDRVYRYGGEELAVIFNTCGKHCAKITGDRIIAAVQNIGIQHSGSRHGVITISAGLVEYNPSLKNVIAMIDAADNCLYEAKSQGKNCLQVNGEQYPGNNPPDSAMQ